MVHVMFRFCLFLYSLVSVFIILFVHLFLALCLVLYCTVYAILLLKFFKKSSYVQAQLSNKKIIDDFISDTCL